MDAELEAFHREFFQEVHREAEAGGRFAEDSFFEKFCDQLEAAGELDVAHRGAYLGVRGVRVDGYGGDPTAQDGVLTLIIAEFSQQKAIAGLTATEMDAILKRVTNFLSKSLEAAFRSSLEESSPGFGLADLIASTWQHVRKVRVVLITNRLLSARVDGRPAGILDGVPIVFSVWDLGRLHRYVASGREREEILVQLADHGHPVPVLPAHLDGAGYEAYLAVLPGAQLASIYEAWGARLLEQNVRVFLQAKGAVNKGIKNTIDGDPEMFFAYNNGITATAEEVILKQERGQHFITAIRNLQIVNGGQTTASIHAAARRKAGGLDRVFVQMKLSVIPAVRAEKVVPKISEYANSQNKVSAADFFANHPYHQRIKQFSERLFAPSRDGTFRESKWFYERARGQYQDARSLLSEGERKKFDLEYPKAQVFTKTDLAKFLGVWRRQPHIVSMGAQKNFAEFASYIGKAWDEDPNVFHDAHYREIIAKAIIFRETEELVSRQPWYQGGYRAQVVAYAIAKLAHDLHRASASIAFELVWQAQAMPEPLQDALVLSAELANAVLAAPPAGVVRNVTEWAKKSGCWEALMDRKIEWPDGLRQCMIGAAVAAERAKDAAKGQRIVNGIEAQRFVLEKGGAFWKKVRDWGTERKLLSIKEMDILEVCRGVPSKLPSEKQCPIAVAAYERLKRDGCPY